MAVTDSLNTAIANWATALANDSVSPQPSYSLDGQSVSREEWRAGLLQRIQDANQLVIALNPYVIGTRMVL